MKPDITFERSELQQVILELATVKGKFSGMKLAVSTINLSKIEPDALIGVLQNTQRNLEKAINRLNKKYYKKAGC